MKVTYESLAAEMQEYADGHARSAGEVLRIEHWIAQVRALGRSTDALARRGRIYAEAFARIMVEQGESAPEDQRVVSHAKALAERIADEGAER